MVGICLALGTSFNIPILAAVGSVVFDNLPILFAVGIAVGLTGEGTVAFSTMPDATWHPEARDCRTSSPSTTPTCTPAPGTFDGRIATDVDSPLCGPRGAAALFGPQKGATPTQVPALDHGLAHLAAVLQHASNGADVAGLAGAGAAGGLPVVLHAMLNAHLTPGIDSVAEAMNLKSLLADASLVLTGEGCLDRQTLQGKVIHGVARLTPPTCPIVAIAGGVQLNATEVRAAGITAAFSIARGPAQLSELVKGSIGLIEDAASNVAGLFARLGGATPTAQVSRADHLK